MLHIALTPWIAAFSVASADWPPHGPSSTSCEGIKGWSSCEVGETCSSGEECCCGRCFSSMRGECDPDYKIWVLLHTDACLWAPEPDYNGPLCPNFQAELPAPTPMSVPADIVEDRRRESIVREISCDSVEDNSPCHLGDTCIGGITERCCGEEHPEIRGHCDERAKIWIKMYTHACMGYPEDEYNGPLCYNWVSKSPTHFPTQAPTLDHTPQLPVSCEGHRTGQLCDTPGQMCLNTLTECCGDKRLAATGQCYAVVANVNIWVVDRRRATFEPVCDFGDDGVFPSPYNGPLCKDWPHNGNFGHY